MIKKINKILTAIDNNNFNHINKISKFKFNDINNLISNIKNNTISEAANKKKINELSKIKNVEIKGKQLINSQEKLLSLFGDLKTIFNNSNNSNNSNNNESDSNNENENVNENKNKNENESDNEQNYQIEQINNNFKKIDETKSFKDQIDMLKEIPELNDYWYMEYYEDNRMINLRLFKLKFAHIINDVDDNLFEKIFGLTSVKLVSKLINITSKEDNQMLVNDIEINRDKIFKQDEYGKFVIQPAYKCGDLLDVVKIILKFNKTIQPYLT